MSLDFRKAEFVRSAADARGFPRDARPRIVMAGRSNVGKSSTINALLERKFARVSAKPGKTVMINLFLIDDRCWMVDLPGYGYAATSHAERERFSALTNDYLSADAGEIRLMILIVDARHRPTADDCAMYRWIVGQGIRPLVLANKVDKLKASECEKNLQIIRETLEMDDAVKLIGFSAETKKNKEIVLSEIRQALEG